jgi:hypothetical protein
MSGNLRGWSSCVHLRCVHFPALLRAGVLKAPGARRQHVRATDAALGIGSALTRLVKLVPLCGMETFTSALPY